jgi:ribosomal protein L29
MKKENYQGRSKTDLEDLLNKKTLELGKLKFGFQLNKDPKDSAKMRFIKKEIARIKTALNNQA